MMSNPRGGISVSVTRTCREPACGFYRKVRSTVSKYGLLEHGDRVVVGVSGGPDSVALLFVLRELSREYNLALHVAHLNHMFRGRDASEDARFVQDLAGELGLPVTVDAVDVPAYMKKTGISPEEASRRIRYGFYERVLDATRCNKLALGHHADDQAETIIMRFLRGTGLRGLAGIPPSRPGGRDATFTVIRPLIEVSRDEILRYCASIGIEPRIDATNQEPIYMRNKVRLELLPILEGFNPELRKSLCHMASLMRDDEDYLEGAAKVAFDEALLGRKEGKLVFSLPVLRRMHPAIMRRVLRESALELYSGLKDFGFEHVEAVLELIFQGTTGGKISLPRNFVAVKGYNEVVIERVRGDGKAGNRVLFEGLGTKLDVPGFTRIPELGVAFEAELVFLTEGGRPWEGRGHEDRVEEHFDWSTITEPLLIRTRREGDRFMPLGMREMKRLKAFFVDEKVPRDKRDTIPILVDGDGRIIWVVGYRMDERFRVRKETLWALRVTLHRLTDVDPDGDIPVVPGSPV